VTNDLVETRNSDATAYTGADGKFRKGNPGRKPGARHRVTVLAEKLMEKDVEGITNVVIAKALEGNLDTAKIVLERIVPVRRGRPTPFTMPAMDAVGVAEAFAAVIANVASGRLT
jgi:hypothetical protein